MKDTFKRVTKSLPMPIKICFVLAMIIQFIVFLIGEATFVEFIKVEGLAVGLYCGYVGVFHIARMLNEEQFLEYMKMLGGNDDD